MLILGTRPEIIKLSPVIREYRARGLPWSVVHTGQHYSYEMDRVFFDELGLPDPEHNLEIGSGTHGVQTGRMLPAIEAVLMKERPRWVLVQGDTNTVLAGALAAAKLGIRVGHVEAGLRSYDRSMPEELNRVVADHVADLLFAPTRLSAEILAKEGIPAARVLVTGNTVVDAVLANAKLARDPLGPMGLTRGGFLLLTAHRQENVDDAARFRSLVAGAAAAGRDLGLPVVYPAHPRARKMLEGFKLETEGIRVVDPLGYLEFLALEAAARLVLTDSGGVQEECCILKVPCVTLRDNTERPETVHVGANQLAGVDSDRIRKAARDMSSRPRTWENPFGDGRAGARIVDAVEAAA
ncbi:MAG TPA: UDP-N-acetylglucosamine 2-epimerase (non-hydrolyzing) [Candidatus Thermoplasmatota archaeon]|nr:UDP-N-acetylglucosamine 2-epimerase (non-hydrolyzing) [Candidatus Thermoplasmatota archaeon]